MIQAMENKQVSGMMLNVRHHEHKQRIIFFNPLGTSSRIWDGLTQKLQHGYEIVTYDYPGILGEPYFKIHSIAEYASLLQQRIATLPRKPTVLVGYSLGGFVAQQLAMQPHPQHEALILLATSARVHPKGEQIMRHWRSLLLTEPLDFFLKELILWNFSGEFLLQQPLLFDYLLESLRAHTIEKFIYTDQIELAINYTEVQPIEKIKLPTLIIQATDDSLFPLFGAKELQQGIASSVLKFVEAGHAVLHEKLDEVSHLITRFMQQRRVKHADLTESCCDA